MIKWLIIATVAIVVFAIYYALIEIIFHGGLYAKETKTTEAERWTILSEDDMAKITEVNLCVLKIEAGKEEVNVAQGLDYISKLNVILGGDLYKLIRSKQRKEIRSIMNNYLNANR